VDIVQRKKELREQLDLKYGQAQQPKFKNSFEVPPRKKEITGRRAPEDLPG